MLNSILFILILVILLIVVRVIQYFFLKNDKSTCFKKKKITHVLYLLCIIFVNYLVLPQNLRKSECNFFRAGLYIYIKIIHKNPISILSYKTHILHLNCL